MRIGEPERRGDRQCWWWSCWYIIISQCLKTVCVFELPTFLWLFYRWFHLSHTMYLPYLHFLIEFQHFHDFLKSRHLWLAELEYTCMVDKPLAQDSGAQDPLRSGSLGRVMIHQRGFKISPSLLATWFPLSCLIRNPDSFLWMWEIKWDEWVGDLNCYKTIKEISVLSYHLRGR